jgi:hypothetical protein
LIVEAPAIALPVVCSKSSALTPRYSTVGGMSCAGWVEGVLWPWNA